MKNRKMIRIKKILKSIRSECNYDVFEMKDKCEICSRKEGDNFVFSPRRKMNQDLSIVFKVRLGLHYISKGKAITLCDGCHLTYHLFEAMDANDYEFNKTK